MLQGFENIIKAIKDWSNSKYQTKGNYAPQDDIPTKTSDLENDSGFITKVVDDLANYYKKSETYTKEEVAALIAQINKYLVVTKLPTENISTNTIYLAPAEDGKTGNIYNEYLYVNGQWEVIGNTAIDLSGYLTTTGDSSATVSSGDIEAGDSADIAFDEEDYPVLIINSTEKLRVKFKKISDCFNELVDTIKSKIPPLINNYLTTEAGVGAADAKLVADLKSEMDEQNADFANSLAQINSDLIKVKTITGKSDVNGNVYLQSANTNMKILFAACNTKKYYVFKLFKNEYSLWYVTIRSTESSAGLTEAVEVELNIGYIL